MSIVFITGSGDGLGQMAARRLVEEGHEVVLHARSPQRAREAADAVPGAAGVLAGDLSSIAETRGLAEAANERGRFDAVIHNAGIGYREPRRVETVEGWVPTKMGGAGAPDDLDRGDETQAWLAVSDEAQARVSGRYFYHLAERGYSPDADDPTVQKALLDACAQLTGVAFPDA